MDYQQGMPTVLQALSPRSIAVFRALQLGDMLCGVPALRALRAALPQARVTLVGLPWAKTFAARYPRYIDALLPCPGLPGFPERHPDVHALPAFLADAHAYDFDLAIQLHGNGRLSNSVTAWLGARLTVGFRPDAQVAPLDHAIAYPDGVDEIERLLRLTDWLGFPRQGDELEFDVAETDRARAAALDIPRDYVCIHPGARDASRRWDAYHFAAVADALAARGLHIVLTGAEDERPLTHAVTQVMQAPAIDLAGHTDLGTLAAVLTDARLVVCNDTGVSHLAAALRVPSVVVFSASDPVRWAPRSRERHRWVLAAEPESREHVLREALVLLERGHADAA